MEDHERLLMSERRATDIQKWLTEARALSDKIEKRRGQPVDKDAILGTSWNEVKPNRTAFDWTLRLKQALAHRGIY